MSSKRNTTYLQPLTAEEAFIFEEMGHSAVDSIWTQWPSFMWPLILFKLLCSRKCIALIDENCFYFLELFLNIWSFPWLLLEVKCGTNAIANSCKWAAVVLDPLIRYFALGNSMLPIIEILLYRAFTVFFYADLNYNVEAWAYHLCWYFEQCWRIVGQLRAPHRMRCWTLSPCGLHFFFISLHLNKESWQ